MLGAAYGTAEDIEVLWTIVAGIGFLYSFLNTKDAYGDLKLLQERGISNGRKAVAQTAYWSEMGRAFIQAVFFLIGVAAMFLPAPPPKADLPLAQFLVGILIRWGLITSSIILTVKAYLAMRVRKMLTEEDI